MNRRKFNQLLATTALMRCALPSGMHAAVVPVPPAFRFSVMLWTLTKQLAFDRCLDVIAEAGYTGVELVTEYQKWNPEDFKRIVSQMSSKGLHFDSMVPARVTLADPNAGKLLPAQVAAVLPIAKELGVSQFILTSGPRLVGISTETQHQNIVENLKRLADVVTKENVEVVLEPIDILENKDIAVTSVLDAFRIVREVGSPNVKVLYDFYHEQRGSGNVIEKLDNNIDIVGLVHVADVPGRHEPGTGELNYENIYKKLASLHYSRYIAMEFMPTGNPAKSLEAARLSAIRAGTR